ncbi:MAG: hypothetical protein BLM47_10675 [Candidatus Reconcilbacillus cellulovorans]|uniref:Glycosyltransferase 2-like domain-containing protein n=1 Tax=Candidatus Reconcilbacillus cellulovorans TaxID=1906605 RepID=A0A2A6DYG8_9BACL|nr:MAG: hypothetical protein BLM47_10675 [Candidatus Reconcilbacillus cellulovorans]
MSAPLVSVVLVAWNRRDDVRIVLGKLRRQTYRPIEVVVVDNASEDGTAELVAADFPEVRLIRMPRNVGIAAYNTGLAAASGVYAVLLDDDSYPAPDAISRMVRRFESDPSIGVVAFDVRHVSAEDEESERSTSNVVRGFAASGYTMSFNGAGAGVRMELARGGDFYPAEFFLYNNELDAAFRVWDAGYSIVYDPACVVYHRHSPLHRDSRRAPYYYVRNIFWVVWRNYPCRLAARTTLSLFYRCFYAALEQRTAVYVRAMLDAVRGMPAVLRARRPVALDTVSRMRVAYETFFTFYR